MDGQELVKRKERNLLVTGVAGSGKSYLVREAVNLDPSWGVLCATTGVAAQTLNSNCLQDVKTVNATLGFFDVESLKNSIAKGTLRKNLLRIKVQAPRIIIDECSMLDPTVFELLCQECGKVGMGIVLVGDFLQLPPVLQEQSRVNGWSWIFDTPSWSKFEGNVIHLNTQYRQTDDEFLKGLNLLRTGKGVEAFTCLKNAGVKFEQSSSENFKGTTLTGTTKWRDKVNVIGYGQVTNKEATFVAQRSGYGTSSEWKDIPNSVTLKVGIQVMVLRNLYGYKIKSVELDVNTDHKQLVLWDADGSIGSTKKIEDCEADYTILQSNGDIGIVEEIEVEAGQIVFVDVRRQNGILIRVFPMKSDNGKAHTEIKNGSRHRIVDKEPTAEIEYLPLTVSYALTIHKSQSLTIPHSTRVIGEDFVKSPAMMYVACSRVKNPTDLTILLPKDQSPEKSMASLCRVNHKANEFVSALSNKSAKGAQAI